MGRLRTWNLSSKVTVSWPGILKNPLVQPCFQGGRQAEGVSQSLTGPYVAGPKGKKLLLLQSFCKNLGIGGAAAEESS